jgi:hypothetical protein
VFYCIAIQDLRANGYLGLKDFNGHCVSSIAESGVPADSIALGLVEIVDESACREYSTKRPDLRPDVVRTNVGRPGWPGNAYAHRAN